MKICLIFVQNIQGAFFPQKTPNICLYMYLFIYFPIIYLLKNDDRDEDAKFAYQSLLTFMLYQPDNEEFKDFVKSGAKIAMLQRIEKISI